MSSEEYKIKLETFEGPLALLLHLIEKNRIDIYDIPVARIAEQYVAYLKAWTEFNMEVATEFLTMASTLLLIKSRMLLPKPVKPDEISGLEEEEDPRTVLVERLIEYRRYREASETLQYLLSQRRRFYRRMPQAFSIERALPQGLTAMDLMSAFSALWENVADEFRTILKEEITVQEKMQDILGLLGSGNGRVEFHQALKRSGSKTEMISTFLAILELIRLKQIRVQQPAAFGPIFLMWRE